MWLCSTGNIDCEGEGIVEQAEFCHYSSRYREKCGPPAILLLERINISAAPDLPDGSPGVGENGLCSCEFQRGRRTCLLGELTAFHPLLLRAEQTLLIVATSQFFRYIFYIILGAAYVISNSMSRYTLVHAQNDVNLQSASLRLQQWLQSPSNYLVNISLA